MRTKKRYGEVWPRGQTGWFYFKLDGVQCKLCPISEGKDKAEKLRAQLIAAADLQPTVKPVAYSDRSIASLVESYLAAKEGNIEGKTLQNYRSVLSRFVAAFGTKTASNIDVEEVANWIKEQKSWTVGGRYKAANYIRLSLRHHVGPKKLSSNPLAELRMKVPSPRTDDCIFQPGEYEAIFSQCPAWLQVLVRLLYNTGARPSELIGLRKCEMDWQRNFAAKRSHKTAHKGQKRFIRFSEDDMELLRCLSAESADEYILHGRDGGRLYLQHCGLRFKDAVRASNIPESRKQHLTLYSCRHTFIVDCIEAGVDLARIATRVGHKGTRMIEDCYGHFIERAKYGDMVDTILANFRLNKSKL